VRIARRQLVMMSFAQFGGVPTLIRRLSAQQTHEGKRTRTSLDGEVWNDLIRELESLSLTSRLPSWNQRSYVSKVAKLLHDCELGFGLPHLRHRKRNPNETERSAGNRGLPEFATLKRRDTYEIKLFTFQEGEVIPYHDHPRMTGVICCLQGRFCVESCDLVRPSTRTGAYWLNRKGVTSLQPGDTATLTAQNNNIHRVYAKENALLIDVFTPPYDRNRVLGTRWYQPTGVPPRFPATEFEVIAR